MADSNDPLGLLQQNNDPLGLFQSSNAKPVGKPNHSDLGLSIMRGIAEIPGIATGIADLPFALSGLGRPISDTAEKIGKAIGFSPGQKAKELESQYSPEYVKSQQDIDAAWKDQNKNGFDVAAEYLKNPMYSVNQVAESAPSMLAGGAIGRGLMTAGRVLTPAAEVAAGAAARKAGTGYLERLAGDKSAAIAGGIGEGAIQSGQQMDQYQGNDQQKNAIAALASGGIDALISGVGGHIANKLGLETAETAMAKGLDNTALESGKNGLSAWKRIAGGAASEGILQEVPQSAQEQAWQNYADNKPLSEGVLRQAVEGGITGGIMGAGANLRSGRVVPDAGEVLPPPTTTDTNPNTGELYTPEEIKAFYAQQAANQAVMRRDLEIKRTMAANDAASNDAAPNIVETAKAQLGDGAIARAASTGIDSGAIAPESVLGIALPGTPAPEQQGTPAIAAGIIPNEPKTEQVANNGAGNQSTAVSELASQSPERAGNQLPGGGVAAQNSDAGRPVGASGATGISVPGGTADKSSGTVGVADSNVTTEPTSNHFNQPQGVENAKQVPGTSTLNAGSSAQQEIRQGSGSPAVGGAGVQPGGQSQETHATNKSTETNAGDKSPEANASSQGKTRQVSNTTDAGANQVIARVGTTPKSTEPVTVRNGVVYIGEYPAQNFETGENIPVASSDFATVSKAIKDAGALSSKQRIYAGEKGIIPASGSKEKSKKDVATTSDEFAESSRKKFIDTIKKIGGIKIQEASDITGEKGIGAVRMAPGLFRKDGNALDLVARKLHEAGYITDAEYNDVDGGVQAARDLVREALNKNSVMSAADREHYNELVAREQKLAKQEAEIEAELPSDAETLAEEIASETNLEGMTFDEEDDIPDFKESTSEAEIMRALGFSEDEINESTGQHSESAKGTDTKGAQEGTTTGATKETAVGYTSQESGASEEGVGNQPTTSSQTEDFALNRQTPEELKAKSEADRKAESDKAKAEAEADAKARADAERNSFTLTGSDRAADANHNQSDLLDHPKVSKNTIFTEDAAAAARALLKKKLSGQLNSGIDPEVMQAGITLAGYHIEKGARTFVAYAKAMIADLGDAVKPYLKSWYMGVKYDPRATAFQKEMSSADDVERFDINGLSAKEDTKAKAAGIAEEEPVKVEKVPAKAGTVSIPGEIGDALQYTMQRKEDAIRRVRNKLNEPMLLAEKTALKAEVTQLESDLRKMRTSIFDAEDAIVEAIKRGNVEPFNAFAELFPRAASVLREHIKDAVETKYPNTLDELIGAVDAGYKAHFDYAGVDGRTVWIEKTDNGWVMKSRDDGSGATITNGGAGPKGGWSKHEALDSIESDAKYRFTKWKPPVDTAATSSINKPQEGDGNAVRKLDEAGTRTLEGVPSRNGGAHGEGGNAAEKPDGSSTGNGRGNAEPGARGVQPDGSVGNDAGGLPVSSAGDGAGRRNGTEPRPRSNGRLQQDNGIGDNSGGSGAVNQEDEAPNAPRTDPPQFKPDDFIINDDLGLGEGGQKTKFKNNVAAIRLLKKLDEENRPATPDEQRVLAKYVGWGGIPQAFDESNKDWAKEYAELRSLMSEQEFADAARSTRYAHYTSREVIVDGIYAALRSMGFNGGRVLEAGAGVGNFIGLMPIDMRSGGRVTAIEREPFAVKIAKQLYPKQNVQQADFTEFQGSDNYYDVAVGNPPFASDKQVDKSGRKHLSGLSLHNYFFAKAVDMLREGGILAQVVTSNFLDSKGDAARRYISDRAKLLGAIRLPNNAFSKNANTEVTTDLIFLQKLPESEWGTKATREDAKRWMDVVVAIDDEGNRVPLNQYFADNEHMMLGKYGAYGTMYGPGMPALIARDGQDTLEILREAVANLPANVYTDRSITNTDNAVNAESAALGKLDVLDGGFYSDGDKLLIRVRGLDGETYSRQITPDTQWTEKTKLGESGFDRIKQLVAMRDTLRKLLAAEIRGDESMNALRDRLNEQYDSYTKKHGLLNDMSTSRVFGDDPDYPLLASLEYDYTRGMGNAAAKSLGIPAFKSRAKKAPIFNQRVVDARKIVEKADSPADAIAISMAERGKIDAEYIGKLLGMQADEVLEKLSTGDKPLLFIDPATNEYMLRDAYLSGNVRDKLKQAKAAGMMNNVQALEEVIPEDVGAHEIAARVGSPWVPESVYEDFAKELFGEGTTASITYIPANSSYSVSIQPGSEIKATNTWGTKEYSGDMLLSAILNNRTIKVSGKDFDGRTYTLVKETEDANTKAQEIRDRFQDWLFSDPERSEILVRAYNDTNNNYVTRKYDGSWMRFPGKVPDSIIKFRRHQRNAIARIVQDRTVLLDHVVGAGKTYTIIAAAMELKRTGLAKKPMIVVPNHLVKQWAADFYRLYPGANILTATKKDFSKLNRRRFLAKIATGDWDAVIIAHSSFGFIKPSPEFEARFNEEQIKNIVKTINSVKEGDGESKQKKRTVKQLQGLIERLENRIEKLRDKATDDLLDFGQIGVDQLFVDEAHLFKNLMFSTKMQNVQGLGDPAGSQRAYDMYIKANQIFEKNGRGQGLVFATGTPVSNSLAEMYHMMRYLMPDQMKEAGFDSFDSWANTFASVQQVFMQNMGGDGYKPSNRMNTFVNTTELLKMFDQVSDTVTMEDIKAAFREEHGGREFPLPKLKDGKRQPVALTRSQAQTEYMAEIAKRAKELAARGGRPEKGEDNALVIMTDARKAAMDIRLVRPEITERESGGRIDRAADEIFERYQQYDDNKGAQLVFSDLGTPLKQAKAEIKEYEELRAIIDAGNTEQVQSLAAVGNEDALAKVEASEAAQEKLNAKGRDWLDAINAALRGFSVYDDLRSALVERGIPEAEIAFIHDANTDDQKAALFRKVNSGQIRVLIGSTSKMGAGTNVQERLVALHHLDVPWKPSDVEQREGRIIRQGNKLSDTLNGFEVEILAYVTQDTLDLRMWQIQEAKLKMINQLRTRNVSREIENPFDDMEMSAGEMQAAATGNMDLLKEIQMRSEIKKLEQRKRSFEAQKNDIINRARKVNEQLASLPKQIEKSKRMDGAAKAYRNAVKKQRDNFKVVIDGTTYTDPDKAGEYLEGKINAKVKDENGNDRAAPISVVMNGKEYTSRALMSEAYANIKGDASPFMLEFNGKTYNRRSVAAKAIAQEVADAVAEDSIKNVGKMGELDVSVEGQKSRNGKMLDVVVGVGNDSLNMVIDVGDNATDAVKIANQVIKVADSLVTTAGNMLDYNMAQLERAKKTKEEIDKTKVPGEWPDTAKLEKARAEYSKLLSKLRGAEEKQDDNTSDSVDFLRATNGLTEAETVKRVVRVQNIVNWITAHWRNAPEIIVVSDMQDSKVPQRVRDEDAKMKARGAKGEPRGFITGGKVYIVASQHKSVYDVIRTVAHEVLGHAGLRGMFGDALDSILRQIVAMRRAEVDAKVKEYGFDPKNENDLLKAAEEVLVNMAETRPEIGFVKRAIAAIRQWLRSKGMNLKLTDNDIIANYILPARAFIENGGKESTNARPGEAYSRTKQGIVTLDNPSMRKPQGDTWAGHPTIDEYQSKLKAEAEQAKRIADAYRNGDLTGRYGIRTAQETQSEEDKANRASTKDSTSPMFSRTVEMQVAVSQRITDLLTTQKTFNGWWHKSIGTPYHKSQIDADYRKVFDSVQSYISGMATFANSAADMADKLIPQLKSISDLWKSKRPSQADIKAISAPIFAGTLVDEKVYSADELRNKFKLTENQIELYRQFRAAVDKSLDDLGKTDILSYVGKDAEHLRDDILNAETASRSAIMVAAHLNSIGKSDDAKAVLDKGMRVADLKAKGYAPLSRFGKYTLYVTKGDKELYFSLFESEAEANARMRELKADPEFAGATFTQGVLSSESYKLFNGISPDTLELFADAIGAKNKALVQQYIKLAKSNRSAMKRLLRRKGMAGFSEDIPRILASFITSNARHAAANAYGGQMDKAAEAIPKEKGDVKDDAIKLIDFVRNPTDDSTKLRGLLFVQYIGGSVASAMVNLTQPIVMSYPYLHQFSKNAGYEMAKAMKLAVAGDTLDADLKQALKRAEVDGVVSPQEIHQLHAEALKRGSGIGALARMLGVKGDLANNLDDLSKRGLFAWGSLFSLAEQFNRRSTFIAAYNIARQNKMADPFAFAEEAVNETQGIYNRGNRSNWSRGAAGALVFTFKQYSIGYMEFLSRLPKKEKAIALAILVLAAGLQGLPFADDLDDLIDTLAQHMGYAWNTKAEKEKFVASILGQTGADFVLHGTSALPGFPIDFSARLGMSNLLPGTGIMLKNKTDKAGEVLDVLGPVGGVIKDALNGEFMPLAVRNALKAADMASTGMYRDSSGKKVVNTDTLDAASKLIGFQPASVARESRTAQMDMQDIQLVRNVESEISGAIAQGIFTGDKEAVTKARQELADWNANNPDKKISITSKQVMERVKKMAETRQQRIVKSAPKELRGELLSLHNQ
jgi:N12 class adenine-specific DNA methylase